MIIASEPKKIERDGVSAEQVFRIKASAKAFKILSDGLYSNKILAVIREYTCNAIDSHVAAGRTDVPIEVHLPNTLEPYFSVKDFGVGLEHEDVMNIYTTYFESTKNSTNDQIGGLGIGGKAFFAYTDSFMVISRFNGMERIYTAFINELGCPSITLMGESETDEVNGLEVKGEVKADDFDSFIHNASTFFSRVRPMPVFTGVSDFKPNGVTYSYNLNGQGWKVRANSDSGAVAIMGVVPYPISLDSPDLTATHKAVLRLPIDIQFNIGDIEVAASREALSFTPDSIKAVIAKLDAISVEVRQIITDRFAACKNMWEARILMRKLVCGELSKFKTFMSASAISFNGEIIRTDNIKIDIAMAGVLEAYRFIGTRDKVRRFKGYEVEVSDDTVIYINDLKTGSMSRIRNSMRAPSEMNHKHVYLFTLAAGFTHDGLLEALGKQGETLLLTSSLPKPPRGSYGISDKGKAQILALNLDADSSHANYHWDLIDEDFDIEDGGVYAPLERYNIFGWHPQRYWYHYLANMQTIGADISTLEVYGFKPKVIGQVQNHPKWKSLDVYLKEKVAARMADPVVSVHVADHEEVRKFDSEHKDWLKAVDNVLKGDNFAKEILGKRDVLDKSARKLKNVDTWREVAQRYNCTLAAGAPTHNLLDEMQALVTKCPMLKPLIWSVKQSYSTRDIFEQFKAELSAYLVEKGLTAGEILLK